MCVCSCASVLFLHGSSAPTLHLHLLCPAALRKVNMNKEIVYYAANVYIANVSMGFCCS